MMWRVLLPLFSVLLVVTASHAQPQPAAVGLSSDQARLALDVLNDPKQRAAFAATLEAIAKAHSAPAQPGGAQPAASQPAAARPPASPAPPATPASDQATPPAAAGAPSPAATTTVDGLSFPLAPDSLGAQVLVGASDFVNRAGVHAMQGLRTVQSVPLLWGWVVVMATNPVGRDMLVDVAWRLAIALVAAAAVEFALRRLMRRPIASLEAIAPTGRHPHDLELTDPPVEELDEAEHPTPPPVADGLARAEAGDIEAPLPLPRRRPSPWTLLRRVPLVLTRLLLELVPVLGLAAVGHLIAGSYLGGQTVSRLVILAVIDAYAFCAALFCVARMLLSPTASRLRLFHIPDVRAHYAMRWIRRLVLIAVFGYAIGEVGLLLGLSDAAHEAVQKAVGLVLHVCLAIIVLQQRRRIRLWLRAPAGATGVFAALRNRFAAAWHWVALFFLAAIWLVYAVEVPHGMTQVLRYFLLTAAVLILARLLLLLVLGFLDRALRIGPEAAERYPGLESRLRLYHPVVAALTRAFIFVLLGLALLQVYGLGTFTWLVSSLLGQRILSAFLTVGITVLLAFAVWEGVNAAIERHLARLQRDAQVARSARLRTLLPLLRTTLLITVLVIAGLMMLSQVGVNIAPLLAGAGIIGVAIGFGSQKLVQDLITGIFLLLENAMQVGDVVSVGGLTGVVESLSVRTIRLRSEDGSVHIIPFSSVTTVTNMTRDFSRAVIVAGIAYKEDYDRVVEVLKAIVQQMRTETAWQSVILDDLEVWGLDQFGDSAVMIKCRIMCTPFGRWPVMREFNRRMKMRFDELGIEIPFPHRKLVVEAPLPVSDPAVEDALHANARAAD